MKYTIVAHFFTTFLVVSVMASGENESDENGSDEDASDCLDFPEQWHTAASKCFDNAAKDTLESYYSFDETSATREAKCLSQCYFTETGEFVDGKFDGDIIGSKIREYVGDHVFLNVLVEGYKAAAILANAQGGDDCDKAYIFDVVNSLLISQVSSLIFCQPEDDE